MIATQQQTPTEDEASFTKETALPLTETDSANSKLKNLAASPRSQLLLQNMVVAHHPKAGLNPIVDAAAYLISVLGKLKQLKSYRHPAKLHKELVQEINIFQDTIKNPHYNAEYIVICRYILCATFDDIIANTSWGAEGQWDNHCLLGAFNQDTQHQDKFFSIMERAIKEPALYIDLMELMYICLSMGYKGQYRATEHSQYLLEQITNNLYKHIRAYRGNVSKTLSPAPLKTPTISTKAKPRTPSFVIVFFVTACIIMSIFISLGYLMDVISNEAYKNISPIETHVSHETLKQ